MQYNLLRANGVMMPLISRRSLSSASPTRVLRNSHRVNTLLDKTLDSRQRSQAAPFPFHYQTFSSTSTGLKGDNDQSLPLAARFAVVEHSKAYEAALTGLHGKQLELAKMEGYGKDDAPFDPFVMEEEIDSLLDRAIAEAKAAQQSGDGNAEGSSKESVYPAKQLPEDLVGEEDDEAFEVTDDVDDVGENEEDVCGMPSMYNSDGSLQRRPSQVATLRAGYPGGGLFAILSMAGSQHKVTTDDVLIVNLLKPVDKFKVGSVHTFKDDDVLLVGSSHYTLVGMPHVKGAEVDVLVEEITKDAKVIVFKKRRRKNSKRKRGFRRDVTMLRVLDIRLPEASSNLYYLPRTDADLGLQGDRIAAA